MQIFHHRFGKIAVFAGVAAALGLGIAGYCTVHSSTKVRLEALDTQAQPYFDEARQNIPNVVAQLTTTSSLCKICWLMVRDKLTGSTTTQEFLASALETPIIAPCCQGAKVYGCDFDSASFLNSLEEVNADYAVTKAYAMSGLALEAIFLKTTLMSLRTVLSSVIARLAVAYGGGAACALADGPFPFGDAIGVVMAVGGTVWCCYDLYKAKSQLPIELTAMLQQAISDCQQACRIEAIK